MGSLQKLHDGLFLPTAFARKYILSRSPELEEIKKKRGKPQRRMCQCFVNPERDAMGTRGLLVPP